MVGGGIEAETNSKGFSWLYRLYTVGRRTIAAIQQLGETIKI